MSTLKTFPHQPLGSTAGQCWAQETARLAADAPQNWAPRQMLPSRHSCVWTSNSVFRVSDHDRNQRSCAQFRTEFKTSLAWPVSGLAACPPFSGTQLLHQLNRTATRVSILWFHDQYLCHLLNQKEKKKKSLLCGFSQPRAWPCQIHKWIILNLEQQTHLSNDGQSH